MKKFIIFMFILVSAITAIFVVKTDATTKIKNELSTLTTSCVTDDVEEKRENEIIQWYEESDAKYGLSKKTGYRIRNDYIGDTKVTISIYYIDGERVSEEEFMQHICKNTIVFTDDNT